MPAVSERLRRLVEIALAMKRHPEGTRVLEGGKGMEIIVAIAGASVPLLITLYVAYVARKVNERTQLILAVIFNGLMELGLQDEAIGRVIEPLIQRGCVSGMTKAGGHRYLQVSKKGIGILGTVGNLRKMPRTPIDIKWD